MADTAHPGLAPRIWQVGALCRAVAEALESRFNPVAVRGEVSGFSRASSGHCYFSLKDPQGQLRCAMFRRAASLMDFQPRDGEMVEVTGRLGVYEPRGDLQLIVEILTRAVQGAQAPAELVRALTALYRLAEAGTLDVILLVRGGGSIEDLWAFNDEQLARTIVQSPVPLICGVGHETDFTIADFCADLRAPTPTAAAELAAKAQASWLDGIERCDERLQGALRRRLDTAAQRLDVAASRLGRPLARMGEQHMRLGRTAHRLRYAVLGRLERASARMPLFEGQLKRAVQLRCERAAQALERSRLRLELLDPRLVLQRGYALLTDEMGSAVTSVHQTRAGQALRATLADGEVDLRVIESARRND